MKEEPSLPLPFLELPYFNGLGGYTLAGGQGGIDTYLHLSPRKRHLTLTSLHRVGFRR
jgi:hypothetical protein